MNSKPRDLVDVPASTAPVRAVGAPLVEPPLPCENLTPWLSVVLTVVIFGGGLFGYDQGVISGALPGIKVAFSLSLFMVQVVTSWVTLGALVGSLACGALGDWVGRKRTMLLAGALFTFGAAVQGLAPEAVTLVAGRFIVGLGVGVAAVAAPLYVAELAPASQRGRFISSYQLAITVGIFLAYLVNAHLVSAQLSESDAWRVMLGAAAVPGLALFLIALVAPESPRRLMMMRRRSEAGAVTHKLQPQIDVDARLNSIELALRKDEKAAPWREIFYREWRRPLVVAIGLAIFQQITGINAITAVNRGSAYLVSQFFLSLVEMIGSSLTFWLFALFCAVGWVWIYRVVPETKQQSLEQIQQMWMQKS